MRKRLGLVLAIIGALLAITSVAAGAHIERWQAIFWPALVIFWAALELMRDSDG
jgi:hypothetical protein